MRRLNIDDYIGKKFNRLTVLSFGGMTDDHKTLVVCSCECGNTITVPLNALKSNNTKSCGCLQKEKVSKLNFRHGLNHHNLYKLWERIKARCYIKSATYYELYGGRGIEVCREWLNDPVSFINWCLSQPNWNKKNYSLDRIDVNGNYSPDNCRFVDKHIQAVNRRLSIRNKSGYKGVGFCKKMDKWISSIRVRGKSIYLGSFKSKREALDARNKYIIENDLTEYKIQEWKGGKIK